MNLQYGSSIGLQGVVINIFGTTSHLIFEEETKVNS